MNNKLYLIAVVILLFNSAYSQKTKATITAKLPFLNENERIVIKTMPYGYNYRSAFMRQDTLYAHNGNFNAVFPVTTNTTLYIEFSNHPNNFLEEYYISPGDNVRIRSRMDKYVFEGKDAKKFTIRNHIKEIQHTVDINSISNFKDIIPRFKKSDDNLKLILKYLSAKRGAIKESDFQLLRSEAILTNESAKRYVIERQYITTKKILSTDQKISLFRCLDKFWKKTVDLQNYHEIAKSPSFALFFQRSYKIDSCLLNGRPYTDKGYALTIASKFQGLLKDKLMVHLYYNLESLSLSSDCFSTLLTAINEAKAGEFKDKLQELALKKSEVLPDFAYEDIYGKIHRLTDFRGKAVIVDTWHPGCGPCRAMAPALKEIEKKWRDNPGVQFLSICNGTPKVDWLNNIEKYSNFEVLNLSIEKPENDRFFTAINPQLGDPALLLIDGNGRISSYLRNPLVDEGREINDKITQVLNQLKQ